MSFWKKRKCNVERIPVTSYWEEKFPFLKKERPIEDRKPYFNISYATPQEMFENMYGKKEKPCVETEPPKQEIKRENITIKLDSSKGIFKKKELTKHEIEYLKCKEYVEICAVGVASKKQDLYFILPRSNESPIHFFLCKVIADYLKEFTKDVRLYQTTRPDIVFGAGGKKYAVEVETGTRPSRNPKGFEEKVRVLRRDFKGRWWFVVTDRKLRSEYARWGKTIVRGEVAGEIGRIFDSHKLLAEGAGQPNPAKKA